MNNIGESQNHYAEKKKARHKMVQTLWFYLDEALK